MLYVIIPLLAGLALLLYMLKEAFANRLIYQELSFPDFPDSFDKVHIFFISDIHRRSISEKLLTEVNGKADIVIIGGDLTEKRVPFQRVKENILKLKGVAPVYFIWGNNDYEVDYHELDALLLDCGVKILDNTSVCFESGTGDKISLIGVDDMTRGRVQLGTALSDAAEGSFKILASHNPDIIKKISPEDQISLVLSGHTHGGQIHIFGYSPYKKGETKREGSTTFLVSNGYGTSAVPLRLGARAETHLLTLKHGTGDIIINQHS